MDLSQFHFSHPLWLWLWLIIPLVGGLFFFYRRKDQTVHQLEKFIDKHLIPYLLLGGKQKKAKSWMRLLLWCFVWSFFVLALAGPRWDFREIATFTRDQSLVILLDLSESMNAQDVSPSRLGRAKQKIEDLLHLSNGVKVALVAFAADPHMIVPLTEDKETVHHLLPSLDTDLVYVQGSKLAPALEMAATMLENEPGNNKAIVVITDGGFESSQAIQSVKKIKEKGIVLYVIGVGSLEGTPLKDRQGSVMKKGGSLILSKLEKEKLREISKIGKGRYFEADHSSQVALIFDDLKKSSDLQEQAHKTQRVWQEHFYLFLLPILPFFLLWYRRGFIFVFAFFIFMPSLSEAAIIDYFYNQEQLANEAYERGDYERAIDLFQDPYRKGVAYYRLGNYQAAEEMFRQSNRPEVAAGAAYNLANALAQQNKLQEAIIAYEEMLKNWPEHKEAKENLDLVKKMLQQEKEEAEQKSNEQKNSSEGKNQKNPSVKKDQQNDSKSDHSPDSSKDESSQESSLNDSSSFEEKDKEKQNQEVDGKPDSEKSRSQNFDEKHPSFSENKINNESSSLQTDKKETFEEQELTQGGQGQNQAENRVPPSENEGKDTEDSSKKQEAAQRACEIKEPIEDGESIFQEPLANQTIGEKLTPCSQEDLDADLWLNQIKNDPKLFLKNKFYLESKKMGTQEEAERW